MFIPLYVVNSKVITFQNDTHYMKVFMVRRGCTSLTLFDYILEERRIASLDIILSLYSRARRVDLPFFGVSTYHIYHIT